MKRALKVMVVPVGREPELKTLESDENGSFLKALQGCVGGHIEPMGYLFDDAPTVYCNEEGKLPRSECLPNRAIYATEMMAAAGYVSPNEPSRAVKPNELFDIVFGDMVCVGFDAETGEGRDITPEECERVRERFGGAESIDSGASELLSLALAGRLRR